jgi:N-methylhydantoinase A
MGRAPRYSGGHGNRSAYFGTRVGRVDTPVLDRASLSSSPRRGPLIVEEYDATTVVPPDCSASLDTWGNIIINIQDGA